MQTYVPPAVDREASPRARPPRAPRASSGQTGSARLACATIAVAEEGVRAMPRPVDELVRDDRVARRELLAQAPAGRGREQRVAAEHLEAADVGPVVDLGRRDPVAPPVAREKCDRHASQGSREIRVRRGPERRLDPLLPQARRWTQGRRRRCRRRARPARRRSRHQPGVPAVALDRRHHAFGQNERVAAHLARDERDRAAPAPRRRSRRARGPEDRRSRPGSTRERRRIARRRARGGGP